MARSSLETDSGAAKGGTEPAHSQTVPHTTEKAHHVGPPVGRTGTLTSVLSSAGHSLEEAQAELVLNPLQLAFETKNLKIIEPALDCLHVCPLFLCLYVLSEMLYRLAEVKMHCDVVVYIILKSLMLASIAQENMVFSMPYCDTHCDVVVYINLKSLMLASIAQ